MHTRPSSPIQEFESRIKSLPMRSQQLIATFLTQASYANIAQFLNAISWTKKLQIEKVLSDIFWPQLTNTGEVSFPYQYSDVEEGTLNLLNELVVASENNSPSKIPNPALLQESIYIFLNCCAFYSGSGNVARILNTLNNCISQKIDCYFNTELKMNFYQDNLTIGLEKIYEFPAYQHVLSDLNWVISNVEKFGVQDIPTEVVNSIRTYAEHSETLILRETLYI